MNTASQPHPPFVHEGPGCEPAPADILNSLDTGLLVVDLDQAVVVRNGATSRWLPMGSDLESIFTGIRFLGPFEGWAAVTARIIHGDGVAALACAVQRKEADSPVVLTIRCCPLREDASGRITGTIILIQEASDGDTMDERIEVSQRLASLGKLAARVAHELNNPLDGILRYINLSMRMINDSSESKLKSYLSESRTGLMRMVQIIGDLLEFTRTTEARFDEADINEVVEQAIRANAAAADTGHVVVAADYQCSDMPMVRGSRLYQVCCNLIRNAIDAMPKGGRITITSGLVGDDVVIRVADTGLGLPPDVEKVFEPFYTTKAPGKGTGLGLAICKDFIEDMRGTITASPGSDGGAIFTVRIPVRSCRASSGVDHRRRRGNAVSPGRAITTGSPAGAAPSQEH